MSNSSTNHLTGQEIAIISMAGRFPGAKSVEEFWSNLRAGVESITTFTVEELLAAGVSQTELRDPNYVRAKGVLDDIELFDASFFGFSPREAEITDPQHRLFLECAWETLERAGYDTQRYEGRIGVYGGGGINDYFLTNLLTNLDIVNSVGAYQASISNDKDYLSTRVSYKLNLKGPSFTVQTACSTSLVAVHLACQSLISGECDMALAGGISISVPQISGYQYREGGIASPDGHCRPFDAQANGTLGGSGVGLVLLKRFDEALVDGDIIHAVIKGSAINNDGARKIGYTAPSVEGQAKAIIAAQLTGELSADSISYVEAHGTATVLGDPVEVRALTKAFRSSTDRLQFCALGSVKSNVGHLDAAAGVTGLIKTVLALKHRELPPSLHYTSPNPEIDFAASPFYVNHELRPWETNGSGPLRAGVSSFGIGGTNAHVVVEEAPRLAAAASTARGWHLLVLSGRTEAAVRAATEKLRRHLEAHPDVSLADVAYTLQVGRREFSQRRAVVCRDVADALEALSEPGRWIEGEAKAERGAVLMYSGQGAQYVGMGRELYECEAVFRATVDECAAAFRRAQGYDLREVLYPQAGAEAEAEARLRETEVTQPALFVLEYGLTRLWQQWGLRIEALMGHSIGEYVAACVTGLLSVEDAVRLVGRRGRLMQGMERGAMLAVRLNESELQALVGNEQLWVAAVNGPEQCVLSGSESAIAEAEQRLTAAGIGVKRLATSHAFHSGLMREAAQSLAGEFNGVASGEISIPYISNVSGSWAQVEEVRRGEYWGRQMLERVQWWRGVEEVLKNGAGVLLEVGPGESLTSVVKEGVRGREVTVLSTLRGKRGGGEAGEREMVARLGELWVRGVGVKWGGMYAGEERRRVELPTYEFERERYWVEARATGNKGEREGDAEHKEAEIAKWFYVPVWQQSVGRRGDVDEVSGQKWLVLREESGLSDQLVERLETAGAEVVRVSMGEEFNRVDDNYFVVHPGRKKELERLVRELMETGWRPQRIVHLWNVSEEPPGNTVDGVQQQIEQFEAAQERGFYSLIYLAHAWGAQPGSEPIFLSVITNNTQRVTGVERLRPEQATVLGPCRVIGQEYPHIVCRSIDVQLSEKQPVLVKQLVTELISKSPSFAVAYRGYERWVQTYGRVQLEAREETQLPLRLRHSGVYLITGGLGKVGLTLAAQLVRSAHARLILTGRAAFPAPEQWRQWLDAHGEHDRTSLQIKKLQSLEAEGAEILVVQADVSDYARMEAALAQAEERFGALNGVIHAAGNVGEQAFRTISETGTKEASQQFVSKVHGLIVLEQLLADRELDFCMLVSSLSAVLGGLGFAAYAAANVYMDTFVQKHNERDERGWLSVNWDGWRFEEAEDEEASPGVTAREGSEVFTRLLDLERATQIIVSTADLNARLRKWIRLEPLQTTVRRTEEARMTLYPRPSLSVAYLAPRNPSEQRVVEIWEELLGVAPVGVDDDFFELGGDSLLATLAVSRLREALQLEIPLRDLFERATVAELAASIDASIEAGQSHSYRLEAPPIVRVSRAEPLPLSFGQQRLWFLDQLEPGTRLWNISNAVRMTGELDVDALRRTMSEIVRRHEVLRTTFSNQDGQPVQVISPAAPLPLELIDLSGLEVAEREATALYWTLRTCEQTFDLAQGPLLQAKLLKLGEAEHVVALVMHHIISDLWSIGILIREVATLYEAFRRHEPSPLPELEIQYADFAHWQRQWLQGEELERQLTYWKKQLAGAPTMLDLPVDKPRPPVLTDHGASLSFFIDEELTEGLKKVSREHDVTLFMTLMAALNILLYRHSGQEDILVGTTIATRNRAETEALIGFFINSLVIRTDFSGRPSVGQLLERVRETALGAYAHQDLPFEKLVEELQPARDMSRSPLYQVNFTMGNTPRSTFELSGLTLSEFDTGINSTKHDFTLIVEGEHRLVGLLEYNTDLFNAPTVARMIEHLQIILQSIVADPGQKIAALPLLSEAEQQQLLFTWNDTAASFAPERKLLHQLFEAQAARSGAAVAVVFEGGQLTYAELDQKANQLAHYLRAHDVVSEEMVGVLMERSLEMVVALLGILKAGAAYLPLDPAYPPERLSFMLADTGLRFVISHQATEAMLPALAAEFSIADSSINVLSLDTEWATVAAQPKTAPDVRTAPENLAYVLYTSGSTGQPKGVMISQGGLSNHMLWMQEQFPLGASDAVLQKTPFSFDASVWEFWAPLLAGARLVMAQPGGHQDAQYLLEVMEREGVTRLQGVPTLLRMLVNEGGLERCKQLREVYSGGEVLGQELAESILRAHSEVRLYNLYGPTETTIQVMWQEAERERVYAGEEVSIGRPITNTQVYVLDGEMQLAPVGVVGELYIGGACLGRGYLKRPALSAERFVPHPYSEEAGARLYRTGDLVRWLEGGELAYLGRVDAQVKLRGFRVELSEIEVVLREHPLVKECIVLVKDDQVGNQQLVGYIILNARVERQAGGAELREYLQERLPEYMVPTVFMMVEKWPLTPSGKVDVRALPLPEVKRDKLMGGYVAPETPVEQIVAGIWADLLKVEVVGAQDNFFELGGHSLLATQVISRIRETFKQEISLRSLFGKPTVAEWAAIIELAQREGQGLEAPPIVRVPRHEKLPLSFAQQRLWFLDQLEPGSSFYNIPAAVRLRGVLNVAALERTLSEVVRRHEALRTYFIEVDGEPVQVIEAAAPLPLEVLDLSAFEEEARAAEVLRLAQLEASRPFDLWRGPLLRVGLLRLGKEEHVALVTMHHIVSDGWSIGVFINEVATLYAAYVRGDESPLEELPIQYADFAHWQRGWLQGEVLAAQLDYWRAELADAPTVIDLPIDKPRPPIETYRGAYQSLQLSAELSAQLRELSRRHNATLFMTLLAAFDLLLCRYAGQEQVLVGTPIANRNRSETEGLIGFFVNTLVLRGDVRGNPSFSELLRRVRETALSAYAHQDLPFEKLVEELQPDRDMSRSPLFQVMFVLQNAPAEALALPGLTLSSIPNGSSVAKFELGLNLEEFEGCITGEMDYNVDLFERTTIERLSEHFKTLLQSIVANVERPVAEHRLLSEAEERQLLYEWNDQPARFDSDVFIHELFAAQAAQHPEAVAVVFENQRLTYEELNRRANQLAHHLQAWGVGPEVVVGIFVERSLEMVVALLGILKAGATYLPLDPSYPAERLSFMLADAGVRFIISHQAVEAKLPALLPDSTIKVLSLDAEWATVATQPATAPGVQVSPKNLAYILYTSGSTGQPKGVMISHGAISNHMLWMAEHVLMGASDVVLQQASFGFDASVWEFYVPLLAGARLVMARPGGHQDVAYLLEVMEREGVTHLQAVPTLLRMLVSEGGLERCKQLREVFSGGEVLRRELAESLLRVHDGLKLYNTYGPTEATIDTAWQEVERDSARTSEEVAIGRPVTNAQVYVLDAQLQTVPVGVVGELYIGGPGLARGYLKRPTLTAERFVPHPYSAEPGARLYRSGDMVRWLEGGKLAYVGRVDEQVKLRGFRVELSEIEVVLRAHASVKECLVLVKDDQVGNQQLVGYILSAQDERQASDAELREYLGDRLPEYMVPTVFMMVERWPLTPSGKVDVRALPLPEVKRDKLTSGYVAPETPVQQIVAGIWADLLNVKVVGADDNFFALGGHSLLATQVISRLRATFKQEISLRSLFAKPTVAGLAQTIEIAQREGHGLEAPPLISVSREEDLPLSFAQQRLWFLDQLGSGSVAYNIPAAVRLKGRLDVEALQRTLDEVVRRHEVLRTTFEAVNGEAVQVIAPASQVKLPVLDLSQLPEAQREEEARLLAQAEAAQPFDLRVGPLLRVQLLQFDAEDHVVLFTMHHIVTDGWSTGILVSEASALYEAYVEGSESPLPELEIQYADYAVWQREWLQGEVLEQQLSYWRQQLGDELPMLQLPTDKPRPPVQSHRGQSFPVSLPVTLTAELKELSNGESVTLFMTLLAAFKILLWRYSGQRDVVVGTPIAGRNHLATEGLIGLFVNTLVLRTSLSGDPSFRELLDRVREVTLGAYAHQDLPFEKLVEELQPERDMSRSPLFQVVFALHNQATETLQLAGLETSEVGGAVVETAKFDITMGLVEIDGQLNGSLQYSTDLFEESTIARMLEQFERLLISAVRDPERRISELDLLSSAERDQLLVERNDTNVAYPHTRAIHELFEEQVVNSPEAPALTFEGEHLSYAELNSRANQLAHYLRQLGVRADTPVGVCLNRSLELVVALLAILKAGGAYVPLDPEHPAERIAFILEDVFPPVILTDSSLADDMPSSWAQTVCLDTESEIWSELPTSDLPDSDNSSDNLAYIMYTSGSTGNPKGVAVPHRAVVRLVKQSAYVDFGASEVFLLLAPVTFDASTLEIWGALLNGGRLVLMPPGAPNLADLGTVLTSEGVTVLWLTAGLFHLMVEHELEALASVRQVVAGGDVLSAEHVRRLLRAKGGTGVVVNGYGPTETTTFACCHRLSGETELDHRVPIGSPIGNTQVYVLGEAMELVGEGMLGELYIGGAGLARGYSNQPGLTADRFVPHPFSTTGGERLYRTGDYVSWRADGTLEFIGRRDTQVKIRGFRVEPGEVEAVLGRHGAVKECAVVVRRESNGEKRLVAYVVDGNHDDGVKASELQDYLGEQLPEFMLPAAIVAIESLPLTANGKVDRRELAAREVRVGGDESYVPPRTTNEELLCNIWEEVLDAERVGTYDNFFDLGGDSILTIKVIARTRAVGLELNIQQLFQYQTVHELAQELERSNESPLLVAETAPFSLIGEEDRVALPAGVVDAYPVTALQAGMLFHTEFAPEAGLYHDIFSYHLRMPFDEEALHATLQQLLERHPVLRTSFNLSDFSEPLQLVHEKVAAPLRIEDLRSLTPAEQEEYVAEWLTAERQHHFDWRKAPLLRFHVARRDEESFQCSFSFHHAILDGWSLATMLTELFNAYASVLQGDERPTNALGSSFRDFVATEQAALNSAEARQYWTTMLSEAPHSRLPRLGQSGGPSRVAGHVVDISGELSLALKALARTAGVPLKSVVLAAHLRALSVLTGSNDVLTGMVSHGRPETADGERVLGLFLNTLPFRRRLAGGTWLQLVQETFAAERELLPFRHYPMARMQQDLGNDTPLFEIAFNFTHFHAFEEMQSFGGLEVLGMDGVADTNFTLTVDFSVELVGSQIGLHLHYDTAELSAEQIEAAGRTYLTILESMTRQPLERYEHQSLLSPAERQRILYDWNDTREAYDFEQCLQQLIEAQ